MGRWVNAFRARQEDGDGALAETERTELLRLRKDNSDLKLDRSFLKKPRSSSPGKRRIRTGSVLSDAGGEEQLHGRANGKAP